MLWIDLFYNNHIDIIITTRMPVSKLWYNIHYFIFRYRIKIYRIYYICKLLMLLSLVWRTNLYEDVEDLFLTFLYSNKDKNRQMMWYIIDHYTIFQVDANFICINIINQCWGNTGDISWWLYKWIKAITKQLIDKVFAILMTIIFQ